MSKIASGLIIGLIIGAIGGAVIGFQYYKDQIEELNQDHQIETKSIEDVLQEQITNINQLLDNSQTDYTTLENDYNNLQNDFQELSSKYDELMDDYSLVLGELPLTPDRTSTELIRRDYQWDHLGETWELSISIPKSISDFYENQDRIPTEDYSVYVTHPFDDEYLRSVIEKLNVLAIQEDLTESEKVNLLISFVQSLPYTFDNISTPYDEYPRFPIETLIYGGGDCEDASILTAALLYEMEYDVILINPPGHMAVGVDIASSGTSWNFEETDYYYIETTGEGWQIGECPEEFQVTAYLYGLTPIPVVTHTWEASWDNRQLDISVTVENSGTTMAEDYKVWVAFDAGEGYIWNQVESESFDLQFGREILFELTLDVPRNEYTRLIVEILDQNGYYIDQSYSEWFDT
jgi:gas vesicle protein